MTKSKNNPEHISDVLARSLSEWLDKLAKQAPKPKERK